MLDLKILTAIEIQKPVPAVAGQVAGPVYGLRIAGIERVLDKGHGSAPRIPVVAQSQRGSRHTEFAVLPGLCNQPVIFIQQKYCFVGKWPPDGNGRSGFKFPVHHIVGAVAGNLRGAVQIYKQGLWQAAAPGVQMLYRHDLPAEENLIQMRGHAVGKAFQGGDDAQGGNSPYGRGDFPVTQVVQKAGGDGKQFLWNDLQCGSCFKGRVDVLYGYVKVKGRLVADDIILCYMEQVRKMPDKINDGAVACHHTLGYAGGAGGKDTVQRIRICGLPADGCKETGIQGVIRQRH